MSLANWPKRCLWALPGALATVLALGCSRTPVAEADPVPAAADPALDPRLAAVRDLGFVPGDAQALVRVDLGAIAAAAPTPAESLKTFDFVLRAQQPAAWQILSSAGITVGKELSTLVLVVAKAGVEGGEPYLIAGLGSFDAERLRQALRTAGAKAETPSMYVWRGHGGGAIGGSTAVSDHSALDEAAIGVGDGFVLLGTPPLVRAALAPHGDVRRGPLAPALLAVDPKATVWGVAGRPGGVAGLPALPGLEGGWFHVVMNSQFALRASFATPADAEALEKQIRGWLRAAAFMSDKTAVGELLYLLRKNLEMKVEGTTLSAQAQLSR